MRSAESDISRGAYRPQGVAHSPQTRAGASKLKYAICLGFATAGASICVAGCESSTNATGELPPTVVSMSANAAPYYSDDELTIYWEETPVSLPVKKGTGLPANAGSPYPASPYLLTSDYTLQVNYTVTNLDNVENAVWVTMNPWNQFVRYYPGVTIVSDDETEPNLPGTERAVVIPPKGRVQGTFTTDDMTNLAVKLDIAMDIMTAKIGAMATYDQATLVQHDFDDQFRINDDDPLMKPYFPKVDAGMTGFDLGILAYNPGDVALEIQIILTDMSESSQYPEGKFIAPGQPGTPVGPPPQDLKVPGSVNM
jgi:hypothetical protein